MFRIRSAKTTDVPAISKIASPLVDKRVLLGKEMVETYEAIQEFVVAEQDSKLLGFGALHVMWQDSSLGEKMEQQHLLTPQQRPVRRRKKQNNA